MCGLGASRDVQAVQGSTGRACVTSHELRATQASATASIGTSRTVWLRSRPAAAIKHATSTVPAQSRLPIHSQPAQRADRLNSAGRELPG